MMPTLWTTLAARPPASWPIGDPGLAPAWSVAHLLGSLLPIRAGMSTKGQCHLKLCIAAITLMVVTPDSMIAQLSGRPASVSLTAVVPSRVLAGDALIADGGMTVLQRTATTLDLETLVGLADRPASRIEVRLGAGWPSDAARVLVRNRNGVFQPLESDANVVAIEAPASLMRPRSALQFRVAAGASTAAALAIPVEYRITVGASDQIAVLTVSSRLHLDAAR